MIKVSVIIPFYSTKSGLLLRSVESVLNQSISNIEVIVIDDHSPVTAVQELASLKDSRVSIIRHDKNTNGGIARNTGIDNASGEFIAFLDYDDIWYSDKLEKQLTFWKSLYNETAVIYCRCKVVDGKRNFERPERCININERVGDYLFSSKQIIQTSGVFLSTILARKVMFHDLKRHQDYQYCLSLEAKGATFYYLDKVLYEFVQIPKLIDYHFSLIWLEDYKKYLSIDAISGFKKLVILRAMIGHSEYYSAFKYAVNNKFVSYYIRAVFFNLGKKLVKRFF